MATLEQLRRLVDDPEPILDAMGLVAVSVSRNAFAEQSWDGKAWARRYPWQSAPKLNVAGALADFAEGRSAPLNRRFQDSPAGIDRGSLRDSLSHEVDAGAREPWVEVGSVLPYATVQNRGGESTQPVTDQAKRKIAAWIATDRGKPYAEKLAPLLEEMEHTTQVIGRRFIGVNRRLVDLLAETLVDEAEEL